MAKLIVGNGALVTFGDKHRLALDGALALDGGLITAIGPTAELRAAHPTADFLDARGQYIMPGLVCAHTHTYGAFARGMALKDPAPENFIQILERLWWRLDRALQPDDVYYSALVCLVDAIRHGATTLIDHHASPNACAGSLDIIAQAFRQAGVRGGLCYEVSDREGQTSAQAGICENERFLRSLRPSPPSPLPLGGRGEGGDHVPLLSGLMGLHAPFTLSDDTIAQAVEIARGLACGCHIHIAEDAADVHHSLETYHERPVERLLRLGVLGAQTIAAHCIHVAGHEVDILADTGTMVVHNPRSNMNNAVGTAKVEQMLRQGVRVGLGNDGFTNDMFVEMKAAYLAHKAAQGNPQAMPGDVVQRLAITNNAHIAGVTFGSPQAPARFGELTVGAAADVILVDYEAPTPVTADNLPWHMIFGMDGSMVTTTIVNGRLLMRERELLTLDEDLIFARARERAAALWGRF